MTRSKLNKLHIHVPKTSFVFLFIFFLISCSRCVCLVQFSWLETFPNGFMYYIKPFLLTFICCCFFSFLFVKRPTILHGFQEPFDIFVPYEPTKTIPCVSACVQVCFCIYVAIFIVNGIRIELFDT